MTKRKRFITENKITVTEKENIKICSIDISLNYDDLYDRQNFEKIVEYNPIEFRLECFVKRTPDQVMQSGYSCAS